MASPTTLQIGQAGGMGEGGTVRWPAPSEATSRGAPPPGPVATDAAPEVCGGFVFIFGC